jgi:hypothetical protein
MLTFGRRWQHIEQNLQDIGPDFAELASCIMKFS